MPAKIVDAIAGIVISDPPMTKVAIIGAGRGRNDAPWSDDTWEFWGLNEIDQPRADRWFELHPMAVQNERELAWLSTCPAPCYILDLNALVPERPTQFVVGEGPYYVQNAVEFPLERIDVSGLREYFTCTFAYQIALAILDGFEAIGLWGVELFLGTARERTVERMCVEYWLGVAEGRGIEIVSDSGLAKQGPLYGYDYDKEIRYVNSELARLYRVMVESQIPGTDWDEEHKDDQELKRLADNHLCRACGEALGIEPVGG